MQMGLVLVFVIGQDFIFFSLNWVKEEERDPDWVPAELQMRTNELDFRTIWYFKRKQNLA